MFVCHGNICRSTMAEFLFKDFVRKKGKEKDFLIASAGVSYEEEGNPVHRGTRRILDRLNISCAGKYAVRLEKEDLDKYDYFICMDESNLTISYCTAFVSWNSSTKIYLNRPPRYSLASAFLRNKFRVSLSKSSKSSALFSLKCF